MTAAPAQTVTPALLAWYAAERRSLPWREHPEPYHVLLSELMLQQTRVETVLPYYAAFLERWPSLEDLAAAEEDEVLKAWAGLGYYSRARNLHRCARQATEDGGLPGSVEGLRALPGVGPYTAGAVASIAFGVRAPLVDGNVERVLSRMDGRDADPKSTAGRRALWARAAELQDALPEGAHPGDLNQALMELGAVVCTPRSPGCERCPVAADCRARAGGDPESLPKKAPRRKPKPVYGVAGVLRDGPRVLLGRRPPGLLGRLWEPIGTEMVPAADPARQVVAAFRERAGVQVEVGPRAGRVVHTFTHRRLTCGVYPVRSVGPITPSVGAFYTDVRLVEPEQVALSTLARKVLAASDQPALPLSAPGE